MPFPDPDRAPTDEHMADPRPGDRFTEMYCYWVEVVGRSGDLVLWRDGRTLEEFVMSSDDFRRKHAYGSIPGYWVHYIDAKGPYLSSAEVADRVKAHHAGVESLALKMSLDSCCL